MAATGLFTVREWQDIAADVSREGDGALPGECDAWYELGEKINDAIDGRAPDQVVDIALDPDEQRMVNQSGQG